MPYKPPPSEPIAVVASSCRFSGGATSPSKLWDLLRQPSDVSRSVPSNRFNVRAFFHPDGDYHGTTDAPKAYWLDDDYDPGAFDAAFFGIAPKEAEAVDPQQRLLLETVYEALESAGYQLPQWAGKDVAVYVGAMSADFDVMSQRDDLTTSPYYATGNARSILSNRVSYFYDFRGPSATIDTACSSSLVALHQAVLSLRAGDCSAACVAGVNLMLSPEQFVVESSLHMLSPTGHCHMWDLRGDGYARGEGAAVLLLKPLSRALADGDASRIQAIVRETGVGSDGRTAGITMPSPEAQASLIRSTYRRAGLDITDPADRCQYFEAHGTGTPVGDPREARAIHSAFFGDMKYVNGDDGTPTADSTCPPPLLVGSVKTVIGHTEGAAGVAGILKAMLAMKHSQVPPNLHLERLNPQVAPFCSPSPDGYLRIPTELTAWPAVPDGQPLRASVNSFGFGGTNGHAIIERYDPNIHSPQLSRSPSRQPPQTAQENFPAIPLLLSANSARTLHTLAKAYRDFFQRLEEENSQITFEEVAWRTYASRTQFLHRLGICAGSIAEAVGMLSALVSDNLQSQQKELGTRGRRIENESNRNSSKLLGVFTGQGAQWPGMSRNLFLTNHIYRESIRHMDAVLQACPDPPDWTLEKELQKLDIEGSRVREAAVGQPLCTALQIGLVNVMQEGLGLRFACVVGHSSGEIAAAYAAKRLSSRDAILIAYYRGKSVSSPALENTDQKARGGMLAAGLSYEDAAIFCQQFDGRLCVAASNSPSSTTLSGDIDAVGEAEQQLKAKSVFVRRLRVDKAYHSHHMVRLADTYWKALGVCGVSPLVDLSGSADTTAWISSMNPNGPVPTVTELADSYWLENMVKPVLFREAVEKALSTFSDRFDCAIEVGPHSALKGPFVDTSTQYQLYNTGTKSLPYTSLLQRGKRDDLAFSEFLSFMWTEFNPTPINLHRLLGDAEKSTLSSSLSRLYSDDKERLPAYPWDHSQSYYRESRIVRQFHHKTDPPHELLGSRTRDDIEGCELRWRNLLRVDKLPWLAHHSFQGQPLLPASAYCIMALDAAKALLAGRAASVIELEDLEFVSGIPLEMEGPATEVMFSLAVHHQPIKPASTATDAGDNSVTASFSVFSASETAEAPMRKRCTGNLRIVLGSPSADALPTRSDPSEQPETFGVNREVFYEMMDNLGLQYSGPFEALESIRRRHNFASATLRRFHEKDTTGLSYSPATLDSCLQTCFTTYSSPGDNALWTAFLPIRIQKVSFNMAHGGTAGTTQSTHLAVEAQLTEFQKATRDAAARITGDICVYNEDGDMEIQVEGLTVGSLASTHHNTDRELYLHTALSLDPEDALVQAPTTDGDDGTESTCEKSFFESCERVTAFYEGQQHGMTEEKFRSPWPSETEDTMEQFILSSPYCLTLGKLQVHVNGARAKVGAEGTKLNSSLHLYHSIVEEGRHAYLFHRQVSRIVKQIVHRYPRMSVFSLTDAEMRMSTPIILGLGSTFTSYTSTTLGIDNYFDLQLAQSTAATRKKVHVFSLDPKDDIKTQLSEQQSAMTQQQPFDLVILSTSVFKSMASSEAILDHVKKIMRPGGFLMLVHMPIKKFMGLSQQYTDLANAIITPPDWPDLLDQRGFINPSIKHTDQHYPGGFFITVRQSESTFKKSMAHLLGSLSFAAPLLSNPKEKLLIIGGQTTAALKSLAFYTSQLLSYHFYNPVTTVPGLDDLAAADSEVLASFTYVVLLADLDESRPVLSTLNEQRLDVLRKILLRPDMTMLWVTEGARSGNAENAASYGFARTACSEMPRLILQMLDFDHLRTANGQFWAPCPPNIAGPSAASVVASAFMRLMLAAHQKRKQDARASLKAPGTEHAEHLWILEPEVYIDSTGHRLIPRVVPFQSGNDNFNASWRVVTKKVNTLSTCVELATTSARSDGVAQYQTTLGRSVASMTKAVTDSSPLESKNTLIEVLYSSTQPFYKGMYICIGRDEMSGDIVAAVSKSNASFLSIPRNEFVTIVKLGSTNDDNRPSITGSFIGILMRTLACYWLCQESGNRPLVLIAQDDLLLRRAKSVAVAERRKVISIHVKDSKSAKVSSMGDFSIHPRATAAQMKSALYKFKDDAVLVDLLPPGHKISSFISSTVPPSFEYRSLSSMAKQASALRQQTATFDVGLLQQAISMVKGEMDSSRNDFTTDLISVPALLDSRTRQPNPFQVIDWRAERTVNHTTQPLEDFSGRLSMDSSSATELRGNRTYVLVGITRDMGQSLSTLFVKQGARHIVLASRDPPAHRPQWAKHLGDTHGADIRFEALDVIDFVAVQKFRTNIEQSMPPVGGIVNGAMVLDDHVLTHMTAEIFSRVMRPKTVGSRNLDMVFRDDDVAPDKKLDFFIMTSSFAAIGGHAGQSNYAAANMYMNGIAASRQRRGVAGSVLNIGVIYGLGFLHREKDELYAGLEREGYPPISERDLHHMILEAIVQGRPKSAGDRTKDLIDLTTGLNRFRPNQSSAVALHWHSDPRFSHFTLDENEAGDGNANADQASSDTNSSTKVLADLIRQGTSTAEAIAQQLVLALCERLATLLHLGTPLGSSRIRGDSSLVELGVDSLVAVETRTWLWRTTGRDVPVMRILGAASIDKLCVDIARDLVASRS